MKEKVEKRKARRKEKLPSLWRFSENFAKFSKIFKIRTRKAQNFEKFSKFSILKIFPSVRGSAPRRSAAPEDRLPRH